MSDRANAKFYRALLRVLLVDYDIRVSIQHIPSTGVPGDYIHWHHQGMSGTVAVWYNVDEYDVEATAQAIAEYIYENQEALS